MDWWDEETNKNFLNRAKCMINQYSKYNLTKDIPVDGSATLGENIADNGGAKEAYYAYRKLSNILNVSLYINMR